MEELSTETLRSMLSNAEERVRTQDGQELEHARELARMLKQWVAERDGERPKTNWAAVLRLVAR